MPFILDGIEIKIDGDLSGFEKSLKEADKIATRLGNNLKTRFSSVDKTIAKLGRTLNKDVVKGFSNVNKSAISAGSSIRRVGKDFSGVQKAATRADGAVRRMKKSTDRAAKSSNNLMAAISRSVGIVAIGLLALKILKVADSMNAVGIRIKAILGDSVDLVKIQNELFSAAQTAGVAFGDTLQLFQRFTLTKETLGATNAQLLQLTKNVQNLGVLGGTGADQVRFATIQLTQALNNGVLQAQELNSILEGAPLIARAIEKGMGLLPGTLKRAVLEGNVLSKDVFESILLQTNNINEAMEKLPPTLERSTTKISNAFSRIIAQLEKTTGFTKGLANQLSDIADEIAPFKATDRIEKLNEEFNKLNTSLNKTKALQSIFPTERLQRDVVLIESKMKNVRDQIQELQDIISEKPDDEGGVIDKVSDAAINASKQLKKLEKTLALLQAKSTEEKVAIQFGFKEGDEEAQGLITSIAGVTDAINKLKEAQKEKPETDEERAIARLTKKIALMRSSTEEEKLSIEFALPANDKRIIQLAEINRQLDKEKKQKEEKARLQREENDLLSKATSLIEQHGSKTDRLAAINERLLLLKPKLIELLGSEAKAQEVLNNAMAAGSRKIEKTIDLTNAFGSAAEGAFERAIFSGQRFSKVLQGLAQDIARIFIRQQFIRPLVSSLFPALGKAGGGTIQGPTLVGERGPELFIPSTTGKIVNNSGTRGMMGTGQITVINNNSFEQAIEPTVFAGIAAAAPVIGAQTQQSVANALSGKNF